MTPGNRNSMVSFAQGAVGSASGKTSTPTSAKASGVPTPKSNAATPKHSTSTPKVGLVKKKSAFFEVEADNKNDSKGDKAESTIPSFGPSSMSAKGPAPLNKSASVSAMATGSSKNTTPLSTSVKLSAGAAAPSTTLEGTNSAVNSTTLNTNAAPRMSNRRSSHTKSAPVLAPGGARRRLMSGISEDIGGGSQSTDRVSSPEREKNQNALTREKDKLFKRIKNNKLGHAEAKTVSNFIPLCHSLISTQPHIVSFFTVK